MHQGKAVTHSLMESSRQPGKGAGAGGVAVGQFSRGLQWTERDEWALNDGRSPPLFDRRKTFT